MKKHIENFYKHIQDSCRDFDKKNFDHIPNELNGSHKEINDDLAKDLRTLLLKNLNR